MATIAAVEAGIPRNRFVGNSRTITWTPLANGDSGAVVTLSAFTDRTIQFTGTFGAGGTIVLEGSLDNLTFFQLTDPQGNAISKTAAALEAISEATVYVRPRVTAGDGTTALTAILFVHRVAA